MAKANGIEERVVNGLWGYLEALLAKPNAKPTHGLFHFTGAVIKALGWDGQPDAAKRAIAWLKAALEKDGRMRVTYGRGGFRIVRADAPVSEGTKYEF